MPFEIIRGDITKITADAVVNAANTALQCGGGVCGAIFAAAGAKSAAAAKALQKECDAIGGCVVGGAVITKAYNLPAEYIIHTVGPVWHGGGENEDALLRSAYTSALELAKEHGLGSIAFPLISAGIYAYPKDLALKAATQTIQAFLAENDMTVTLVIYDKAAFEISEKRYRSVAKYIEANFDERDYPQTARRRMADFDRQKLQAREISVDRDFVVYGDSYLAPPPKRLRKSRPKPRPLLLTSPQQQHSQLRKVKCFSWQTLNSIFKGDCNFAVPLVVVVIGFFIYSQGLTEISLCAKYALSSGIEISLKRNKEAANTASALPTVNAS